MLYHSVINGSLNPQRVSASGADATLPLLKSGQFQFWQLWNGAVSSTPVELLGIALGLESVVVYVQKGSSPFTWQQEGKEQWLHPKWTGTYLEEWKAKMTRPPESSNVKGRMFQ